MLDSSSVADRISALGDVGGVNRLVSLPTSPSVHFLTTTTVSTISLAPGAVLLVSMSSQTHKDLTESNRMPSGRANTLQRPRKKATLPSPTDRFSEKPSSEKTASHPNRPSRKMQVHPCSEIPHQRRRTASKGESANDARRCSKMAYCKSIQCLQQTRLEAMGASYLGGVRRLCDPQGP